MNPPAGDRSPAATSSSWADDAIHAVANPKREYAVALHVYGGDFFVADRSEWDEVTGEERPRDVEGTMRRFVAANAAWAAENAGPGAP